MAGAISENTGVVEISLAGIATVVSTEDSLFPHISYRARVTIDMRGTEFVEAAALLVILIFVRTRAIEALPTFFKLPESKIVRDFLRRWEFPNALRKVSGVSFFHACDAPKDRDYFGENTSEDDIEYRRRRVIGNQGVEYLNSNRFFSLNVSSLSPLKSNSQLVKGETDRWEDRAVRSVLNNVLTPGKDSLITRIVVEAMTNAVRHPGASVIVSTSHIQKNTHGNNSFFTICFWDDGKSMVQTLKSAMGNGLRSKTPIDDLRQNYRVICDEYKSGKDFDAQYTPDKTSPDSLVLFSTLLPGISADVSGSSQVATAGDQELPEHLLLPGMGLYVLSTTAIMGFRGSVSFRSGGHFLNAKAGSGDTIRVKIKKRPEILGNMVTVRLPTVPK